MKTNLITGLSQIQSKYDAFFIDLWGVVHNGIENISNPIDSPKSGDVLVVARHARNKNLSLALDGFARFLGLDLREFNTLYKKYDIDFTYKKQKYNRYSY